MPFCHSKIVIKLLVHAYMYGIVAHFSALKKKIGGGGSFQMLLLTAPSYHEIHVKDEKTQKPLTFSKILSLINENCRPVK